MKKLLLLILFIILHVYSFTQTDVQQDKRVNPVLKQALTQKSGYIVYGRDNSNRFINIAVLNQSSHTMTWFTCHGRLFDSTRLTDPEYEQVTSKQLDPFVLFQHICEEYLVDIAAAKEIYRVSGNNRVIDSLNPNYHALFASASVQTAKTPLQKLIAIGNIRKNILTQLAYLNCANPFGLQDNPLFKANKGLAGTMEKTKDSTVYYNIDPTSAVTKVILYKNSPEKLYVFNRVSEVIDSVPVLSEKYDLLLKEKTDVFLLYRGWLELQWQNTMSNILRQTKGTDKNSAGLYSQANINDIKSVETELYNRLNVIEAKINLLISPEVQSVEQVIYDAYKNETSEINYIPLLGIGYDLLQKRGMKEYELTNHLGNVLVTVTDKKLGYSSNDSTVDYYNADVVNAQDYFPFGMLQPGRSYLSPTEGSRYRYGFNGKEDDNEVKGEGNQLDYGIRVYDPRLGRFLSKDPLQAKFPFYTPYQFAGNKPIWAVDLDGREDYIYNLVAAKNSDGKPILALQFVKKEDYNPIIRKIAELNDIPTTYYVMYNGEQVGTYSSEHEMKLATHGKTVDQLRKIENDRMFRNILGAAILHATESIKPGETPATSKGAAAIEEEAAAQRKASAISEEAGLKKSSSSLSSQPELLGWDELRHRAIMTEEPLSIATSTNGKEFRAVVQNIEAEYGNNFLGVLSDLTKQARTAGATSLEIEGIEITNPKFKKMFSEANGKKLLGYDVTYTQGKSGYGEVTLKKEIPKE
jgi:RHS repeat-associated protein